MLERKYAFALKLGLSLGIFMVLLELILLYACTDNLMCLGLLIIPALPGLLFNLEGYLLIIVSLIFWSFIGSLIALLISKLKK